MLPVSSLSKCALIAKQLAVSEGQNSSQFIEQGISCVGQGEEIFTNPSNCAGYLQCAQGYDRPFVRICAPGTLFNDFTHTCMEALNVSCNGRPINSIPIQIWTTPPPSRVITPSPPPPFSNFQINIPSTNQNIVPNPVVLHLYGNQTTWEPNPQWPTLTRNQCAEVGRQLNEQIRTLVSGYDNICTANSNCQRNLPSFTVECLTSTGRVLV